MSGAHQLLKKIAENAGNGLTDPEFEDINAELLPLL